MICHKSFLIVLTILSFAATGPLLAATISLKPATQTAVLGESLQIELSIEGLGNADTPSIGAFDFDIAFNAAILGFSGVAFGDPALGDQLDAAGLGSWTDFGLTSPGQLNLFALSFDGESELNAYQAADFVLATLTFDAIGLGTSTLGLSINSLGDAAGANLSVALTDAAITVTPQQASVPAPPQSNVVRDRVVDIDGINWLQI